MDKRIWNRRPGAHGFKICGKGQVIDTRGECQNAFTYIQKPGPRRCQSPGGRRNLRKYLQSLHRIG